MNRLIPASRHCRMLILLIPMLASGSGLSALRIAGEGNSKAQTEFAFSASLNKTQFKPGEPLHINVRIVNRKRRAVYLQRDIAALSNVAVRITDERGKHVPYKDEDIESCFAPPVAEAAFIRVLPGCSYGAIDITGNWLALSRRGKYTISVSCMTRFRLTRAPVTAPYENFADFKRNTKWTPDMKAKPTSIVIK